MIDRQKHAAYWRQTAREDMDAGCALLEKRHNRQGLFFLHLAVEKTLKGLAVARTGEMPPRTHDLQRLAEKAGVSPTQEQAGTLAKLNRYCLEGRYPEAWLPPPGDAEVRAVLEATTEILEWLTKLFAGA